MSTLSIKDRRFYFVVLATIIVMIGFGFLPPFGQITQDGMRVLGIFLGCIVAWIFGEIVWSSILGLVMLTLFGYGTMAENYSSAYGNNVVAITITSIIFCYSIEKSGLLGEVARWIIGQKWAQKSVWGLIFAFFLTAVISAIMLGNMVPPMVLLWALFYELAKEMDVKPHDPLALIILCGVGVCSCMGNSIMPYTGMVSIVRGLSEQILANFMFNTGEYILLNIMLAIIFLALVTIVLKILFGKRIKVNIPKREPYKMNLNVESKISLTLLICIIICLIVPNFLSENNVLRIIFNNKLTVAGTFMLASVILMVIHVREKPVLDITSALKNVPWPLLLLISSALTISDYMTKDEMGIISTIVSFLNPIMEGKSPFEVTMLFVVIGLIMTNFINDMVTIMVVYPIAAQFILGANGSIMLLAILFAQAAIQGCFMPSGSVIGAMLHGNKDWLSSKEVFIYVGIMEIVVLISLMLVTIIGGIIGV